MVTTVVVVPMASLLLKSFTQINENDWNAIKFIEVNVIKNINLL